MGTELQRAARTLAVASRGLEKAAAPLSLPQYRILALIATAPERASRVAERADVTKATLTGVIDSLVAHGWIERTEVAGDRRGVSLTLTAPGAAVLAEAEAAMGDWLQRILDLAGPSAAGEVAAALAMLQDGIAADRRARDEARVAT